MRMSQEDKDRSHGRIVASASRLFRERGLESASVADVMQRAGMTHGGFYKHFDSKDGLVAEALQDAFAEFMSGVQSVEGGVAPASFRALYLSGGHVAHAGRGCPVAALATEVARASTSLKRVFGEGVRRMLDAVAPARKRSASAHRAAALREFSMLVGAVVVARASDPALADEVLEACRAAPRPG